jgi:hypothetical protein
MQLRPALFAEILLRHLALFYNSNTPTMLPNTTAVTRDEQATCIFRLERNLTEGLAERWARVVLLAANASGDFLFFDCFLVNFSGRFSNLFFLGGVGALAATRGLAHLLAGAGVRSGRLRNCAGFRVTVLTTR